MWRALPFVLGAILLASPAVADCRLALVLAMDVSNSVDRREDSLQRNGIADALLAPEVTKAVFASDQTVAIAAFEWSGRHHQQIMLDWTILNDPTQLRAASARIRNSQRGQVDFPTALGSALRFGAQMFNGAPDCISRTIDIAGDGKHNDGFGPAQAYNDPAFDLITVNGLVVRVTELEMDLGVAAYYQSDVIHGPGAFVEVAQGFNDYRRAMTRKLRRELAPLMIGLNTKGQRG